MNFDGIDNRKSGTAGMRIFWIVLILLLGLLLLATTVMALDDPQEPPRPASSESVSTDSAKALQAMRGILAIDAAVEIPLPITNLGCIQEFANAFGVNQNLGCSANDNTVGPATIVGDTPVCTSYGSTVPVTFTVVTTATAAQRYDIGIYFATDGDPNGDGAKTGQCAMGNLPTSPSPFKNLEGNETGYFCTTVNNNPSNPAFDTVPCKKFGAEGDAQCAAQTIQDGKNFCEQSSPAVPDTCGDLENPSDAPYEMQFTLNATCVDDDGDGFLNLPFCTSYDNQSGNLCVNPYGATPNTSSKCNCNDNFQLPILVPPNIYINKTASVAEAAPGDTFTYSIEYGNTAPGQDMNQVVISDVLHADLALVSVVGSPNPVGGGCEYRNPNNHAESYGDGNAGWPWVLPAEVYGWELVCTMPDLPAGTTGRTLTLEVKVNPNAQDLQDILNTSCIAGTGVEQLPDGSTQDVQACSDTSITTPVSISYANVEIGEGVARFQWQTASEVGNVGFNIYVDTGDGPQRVNDELIPSKAVDSLSPQDYAFEAAGVEDGNFYIEDVSLDLQKRRFGPFTTEEAVGRMVTAEPIDWAAIKVEQEQKAAGRATQEASTISSILGRQTDLLSAITGGRGGRGGGESFVAAPLLDENVRIKIKTEEAGLYRITYEELLSAGFDLNGAKADQLALLNDNRPVPIRVESARTFGGGGFIEFWAEEVGTIYTGTNVYTLTIDRKNALRIAEDHSLAGAQAEPYYLEEVSLGKQTGGYSALTAIDDPWFDTQFFTYNGGRKSKTFAIPVDNLAAGGDGAALSVDLWGRSSWPEVNPDHHVRIDFNGQTVEDLRFDGMSDASFDVPVDTNVLANGENQLKITHIGDTGADFSFVFLDAYGLTYPRAFVAREGALVFEAQGETFEVSNLPTGDVVVYRLDNGIPARLTNVQISAVSGTFNARFAGSQSKATYAVVAESAVKSPMAIETGRRMVNISSGTYDYIIISHPSFIQDLEPLVDARESQGLSVLVVDVEDVYEQFGGGIFGAEAIEAYVAHAAKNMGAHYFLLVGGDTYDYRGYLRGESISFIPSPYAKVGSLGDVAPADPMYFDLDKDGVPDIAHGRFPVRSSEELAWMIEKTLAYQENVTNDSAGTYYGRKAIFSADNGFRSASEAMVNKLVGWDVERVYLDDLASSIAYAKLVASIEGGSALTSYVGHSSAVSWAETALLTSSEAAALRNSGKPTVITQWGCSNSYYVDPKYNTMSHSFLVAGDAGAAAVLGATALSNDSSEELLGMHLTPLLVQPGKTIGDALLAAKTSVGQSEDPADFVDVLLGWTLLGDPAVMVQP